MVLIKVYLFTCDACSAGLSLTELDCMGYGHETENVSSKRWRDLGADGIWMDRDPLLSQSTSVCIQPVIQGIFGVSFRISTPASTDCRTIHML